MPGQRLGDWVDLIRGCDVNQKTAASVEDDGVRYHRIAIANKPSPNRKAPRVLKNIAIYIRVTLARTCSLNLAETQF